MNPDDEERWMLEVETNRLESCIEQLSADLTASFAESDDVPF